MDPNEALLLSVESILDDEELDDAGRNAALTETVKQFSDFTGARHAKAVILKPVDKLLGAEEGVAPRSRSAPGADNTYIAATRDRLRLAYEDKRRSYPNFSDAYNLAGVARFIERGAHRVARSG
jgi:hypothetical protein